MKQLPKKIDLLYRTSICIIFCLIIGVVLILCLKDIPSRRNEKVTNIFNSWVDENGNPVSLVNFSVKQPPEQNIFRIYYTVSNQKSNQVISYYARNMYTNIYVNGELFNQDEPVSNPYLGSSPGVRWHIISIPDSANPTQVCLECIPVYRNSAGHINDIYFGNYHAVRSKTIANHFLAFIFSIFFLFTGCIFLFLSVILKLKHHTGTNFAYIGFATLFSAGWTSCESLMWQFFFGNTALFHTITFLSLICIPPAFALVAYFMLPEKDKKLTIIYLIACTLNIFITTILHFAGIVEFHNTLLSTHVLIVLFIPLAAKLMRNYLWENFAENGISNALCIFIFIGCLIASLYHYITQNYTDFSLYFRIAIISFLLCLITYHTSEVMNKVRAGAKAKVLHTMAITDCMTGFFNRRGFIEHEHLYTSDVTGLSTVGIVMFDANNLKQINDSLGHEKGDYLIKLTSDAIEKSFSSFGKCYRMGGDEFLVVLTGEKPDDDFQTGIKNFEAICHEFTEDPSIPFPVVIAYGYAYNTNLSLDELSKQADQNMYIHKNMVKKR